MKHRILLCSLTLSLGIIAGCGAARPSMYYQLTVPSEGGPGSDRTPYPVSLVIGPITSPQLYEEEQIVYSSAAQAMGTYQYHRWAESPTAMIGDVLLRELLVSGRYRNVNSRSSDVRGDYLLSGRLYDFREIDGSPLVARVAFEFELRDSETGTMVWKHYYSHDEPVNGKEVTDVVGAMNRNVMSGLEEMRVSLEQYFSTQASAVGTSR